MCAPAFSLSDLVSLYEVDPCMHASVSLRYIPSRVAWPSHSVPTGVLSTSGWGCCDTQPCLLRLSHNPLALFAYLTWPKPHIKLCFCARVCTLGRSTGHHG